MTKVSVIIPVYNVEKYLQECLDSVIFQTLDEIEIICVNDASTDGSLAVLREYEARDPRIMVLDLAENRGQAFARNQGIQESTGEYIYFLDADDKLSTPDAFEMLYKRAKEDGSDGIFFDSKVIYENEELQERADSGTYIQEPFSEGIYSGSEFFCRRMEAQRFIPAVWREFWKRTYLVENKLLYQEDTSPIEDLLFTFQAILLADRLVYFPKPLHIYRIRENSSMTVPFGKKRFLSYCHALIAALRFIEKREPNVREQAAFYRYIADIRTFINDNAIKLIQNGEDLNQAEMGTGWNSLYLKMLLLGDYPRLNRLFTPDEYKKMKKSRVVVVYGAGKAGLDVKLLLDRFGISHYQVAVTKKTASTPEDIHEISEFAPYGQDCFVIVAVTQKYRHEMEKTVDFLGLTQHISLDG